MKNSYRFYLTLSLIVLIIGIQACSIGQRDTVLIYYANETALTPELTENYDVLTDWLRSDPQNPLAVKIANQVDKDAQDFPKAVDYEVNTIISQVQQTKKLKVAIFTNQLAQSQKLLLFSPGKQPREIPFHYPRPEHYITQAQPLNQPAVMNAALERVTELFPTKHQDYVLITKSHGNRQHALITRITLDHKNWTQAKLLDHISQSSSRLPDLKYPNGTTQAEYISNLKAQHKRGMHFSLVYIESCKSQGTLPDTLALPQNVDLIYAPAVSIPYQLLDYKTILQQYNQDQASLHQLIAEALDQKLGSGKQKKLVGTSSSSFPIWIYFTPIVIIAILFLSSKVYKVAFSKRQ